MKKINLLRRVRRTYFESSKCCKCTQLWILHGHMLASKKINPKKGLSSPKVRIIAKLAIFFMFCNNYLTSLITFFSPRTVWSHFTLPFRVVKKMSIQSRYS